MLKSYGLEETFTNFRPGTRPALDAAVLSSYRRGEPILFYYWSPTPLMGRADLVRLEKGPASTSASGSRSACRGPSTTRRRSWWRCWRRSTCRRSC